MHVHHTNTGVRPHPKPQMVIGPTHRLDERLCTCHSDSVGLNRQTERIVAHYRHATPVVAQENRATTVLVRVLTIATTLPLSLRARTRIPRSADRAVAGSTARLTSKRSPSAELEGRTHTPVAPARRNRHPSGRATKTTSEELRVGVPSVRILATSAIATTVTARSESAIATRFARAVIRYFHFPWGRQCFSRADRWRIGHPMHQRTLPEPSTEVNADVDPRGCAASH